MDGLGPMSIARTPHFPFFFIQNYYHVLCSCWVVVLFGVSVIVWLVRFRRFPRWWHLPRPPLSFPSCPFFLLFGHWTWSAHLLFWSRPSLSLLAVCPMLPRQHDVPSGNNWRRINKAIPLVADQQRDAQTDGSSPPSTLLALSMRMMADIVGGLARSPFARTGSCEIRETHEMVLVRGSGQELYTHAQSHHPAGYTVSKKEPSEWNLEASRDPLTFDTHPWRKRGCLVPHLFEG